MPLDVFLERLLDEGDVILKAPKLFAIAVLFCSGLVFVALDFHYSGVVAEQAATIVNLRQVSDDDLISINRYRVELNLDPSRDRFSDLSNAELKDQVARYVLRLDDFGAKWSAREQAAEAEEQKQEGLLTQQAQDSPPPSKMSDLRQKLNTLESGYLAKEEATTLERKTEYEKDYKGEGVLLREETIARLPSADLPKISQNHAIYAMGWTTPEEAADLDSLARLLPDDPKPETDSSRWLNLRDEEAIVAVTLTSFGFALALVWRNLKRRFKILIWRRRKARLASSV